MRPVAVLYVLGWLLAISAGAMLIPAIFAAALDPAPVVEAFVVAALVVGVIGVNLVFAFRGSDLAFGRRQNLLMVSIVWLVVPLAGALPFIALGVEGGPVAALFESVSGFTTTGATVISDLKDVPRSLIVWRALLQWLGGLATLVAIVALLGPLMGPDLDDRHLQVISRSSQVTPHHLRYVLESIGPLYLALTLGCFVLLNFSGIPPFDSFCLALSTLSTGGFMPKDGTLALYGLPLAEFVLGIFMLVGAVNVIWLRSIVQGRWSLVREIREPYWTIGAAVGGGLLLGLSILPEIPVTGPGDLVVALAHGFTTVASLITTTGFMTSDIAIDTLPYMAILALCLVGGGRFSTSGGMKFFRVFAMFRQLGREFRLLIYPHGVRPSRFGDEALDIALMKLVWTTLVAFIITISVLAIILAGTGLPLANALMASISAVTNAGPAYDFARVADLPQGASFSEMSPQAHLALAGGMIIGRVEVVAALSLFSAVYWRS